ITVDGTTYHENPLTVKLDQGSHTIKASAPGFATVSKSLTVSAKPQLVKSPERYTLGTKVYWEFTGFVPYEVKINGQTVYSGRSNNITLVLDREGEYAVYAFGEEIARFKVSKTTLWSYLPAILLIVAGAIWIIYQRGMEKYKPTKKKWGRVARMRPLPPPGSEEIREEGGGE
ncbi:hypothetical protein DRO54_10205, partial [Candidatus Bathyarchaeota archaeon]